MIEKIDINFSFGKLLRNLDDILNEDLSIKANDFAAFARSTITEGKLRPLKKSTIKARRSGAGGKPRTGSTTPLHHTGRLLTSIKPVKDGVRLLEYGWHHDQGFVNHASGKKVAPRPFLFTRGDNLPPKLKQRYLAMEKRLYKRLNRALRK